MPLQPHLGSDEPDDDELDDEDDLDEEDDDEDEDLAAD